FSSLDHSIGANISIEAVRKMEEIAVATGLSRYLSDVARIYVTSDDVSILNPAKGLELAKRAHQSGKGARLIDTLACAYLANGDRLQAIEVARTYPIQNAVPGYIKEFESAKKCGSRSVASVK